ncbi:MAG: DUF1934 domain-containing protein [Clostridiales bacterium]|nr:DUF1934 domain-containing protein [Clostridiales bacterium]
MENNAMISIRTNQEIDGENEAIELDTMGKYAIRNNKIYIIYKESEMTGYEDTTTTIKVTDGNVSVSRSGRYTSKMNYNIGETNLCIVNTPYGQIGAAVKTESIDFDFGSGGGVLKMDYLLDADNKNYIKNNMTIRVTTES